MNDDQIMEDTAIIAQEAAPCCSTAKQYSGGYDNRYLRETLVSQLLPFYADQPLALIGVATLFEAYITQDS